MAIFYNTATLTYNGGTTNSNTVAGELVGDVTVTKEAFPDTYTTGEDVTYTVSICNNGTTPVTDMTVLDNLGLYTSTATNPDTGTPLQVFPLTYVDDSVSYYVNGELQTPPVPTKGTDGITFAGLSLPPNECVMLIYHATVNSYAPLVDAQGAQVQILNTVFVSGTGMAQTIAEASIFASQGPEITITKSLTPEVVSVGDEMTYTFIIQNTGTTALTAADNTSITDMFNPKLSNITVTLNGHLLTATGAEPDYTYTEGTGAFSTTAGRITVDAATYKMNTDGTYTVSPGVSILRVKGTVNELTPAP